MTNRLPALLFFFALGLLAQTGGKIEGTVKDASGAVVPGAKVSTTHTQTARRFDTTTNGVGFYIFPSMQNGNYSISIEAAGMETFKGEFLLQTGQTAVVDATLKVGSSATEITVAGSVAPLVTTTSATLAAVTDRARIEQLPISGRMFQSLVLNTTPGLDGVAASPTVWGLRWGVEYLQDGSVLANRDTGELAGRPPGMDTIDEYRVETNNSSAKMNRPGTVIVNTRSGTNLFHGSLLEVARNNELGFGVARRREDKWSRPPHLVRNEFGGSAGGPIYIPKVYNGKNRTFFFYSYEAYRNLSASTKGAKLPTMAYRQGDFSGLVASNGRRYTLYDPWSTQSAANNWSRIPYVNNQIPTSRMSPVAKYLYSVTPVPTEPGVNPLISNNYYYQAPSNRLEWTTTTRIDHRINERDQLFFRYSHGVRDSYAQSGNNNSPTTLDMSANGNWRPIRNESGVASWTHTFSPTFFGETLFSAGAEDLNFINVGDNKKWSDILGLPNPFGEYGFPNITGTGVGMEYITAANRRDAIVLIFNLDQNFTKIKGRHELLFGGRFRHEKLNILPDQQFVQGQAGVGSQGTGLYDPTSGSTYSAVPYTGHNAADLFIGLYSSYAAQFVRKWYDMYDREFSTYIQDNFKVNSRLTLNFGVRWEIFTPVRERNNALTGFDPKTKAVVNGADFETLYKTKSSTPAIVNAFQSLGVKFVRPEDVGLPHNLLNLNKWDFNPRAGFAYRITQGSRPLVLRGGYGIYGYTTPLRDFDARMRQNPPTTARFTYQYTSSAQTPDGLPGYGLRSSPQYIAGVNSRDVLDVSSPTNISRGGFLVSYFEPDQPTSRAHEWNLTFERELFDNTVLRFGYVGTHGSRMNLFQQLNDAPNSFVWFSNTGQPLPTGTFAGTAMRPFENTTFGSIERYSKTGWSNAQNFQIEFQRRYAKGYGFQAFYVLSNAYVAGGNGWDDAVTPTTSYLNGAVPAGDSDRTRFLLYRRDTTYPKHQFKFNWIVDAPFGKGKHFASSAGPILNRVIGGWQLAGQGSINSNWWSLPTDNWAHPNKLEIYGTKYPIKDCRGGTCLDGYLYYNGYIPANRINSYDANGKPNGVMGVPDSYKPSHVPLIAMPKDGGNAGDPLAAYYDSNTVWIKMKDGSLQRAGYNDNLNPWRNQSVLGLNSWSLSTSLFKVIPVKERVFFRLNVDFFNVLNMPGIPKTPDSSSGIIDATYSGNGARSLQFGLRLSW